MLTPAWRLAAIIVVLSVLSAVVFPGASPALFFAGMLAAWTVAALLFVVLRRRERRRTS